MKNTWSFSAGNFFKGSDRLMKNWTDKFGLSEFTEKKLLSVEQVIIALRDFAIHAALLE